MTISESIQELDGPMEPEAVTAPERDSIRQYFTDIGRVRLLTAKDEAAIGRRIEDGRRAMVATLAALPSGRRALREAIDGLRRGDIPVPQVILLPYGGEPDAKTVRTVIRVI